MSQSNIWQGFEKVDNDKPDIKVIIQELNFFRFTLSFTLSTKLDHGLQANLQSVRKHTPGYLLKDVTDAVKKIFPDCNCRQ